MARIFLLDDLHFGQYGLNCYNREWSRSLYKGSLKSSWDFYHSLSNTGEFPHQVDDFLLSKLITLFHQSINDDKII